MKSRLQHLKTIHVLEALWLSAILIIPIACVEQYFIVSVSDDAHAQVPKVALLRIISAVMLVTYLYQIRNVHIPSSFSSTPHNILGNLKYSHEKLVFLSVILVAISIIITTALSTNISTSIWGFIPGQAGYSAYNTICYLVIFTVVATNLKSPDQLRRLLLSIITMGVIVSSIGLFQHFGIDIFGFLTQSDYSRATLTTGNAVTAGSLLLIPILVTVACLTTHLHTINISQGFNKAFIIKAILWSTILSVQFSGLLFTYSRGPEIATISSIALLILTLIIFRKFRVAAIATLAVVIAVTFALAINSLPVTYPVTHRGNPSDLPPEIGERIIDLKTQVVTGGLNQRTSMWKSSAELIMHRPWFESMNLALPGIRPLVGYGPGTFKYVFNLTSQPSIHDGLPLEAKHAHNYFIHKTVTEGILGLVSSVGLLTAPILMSGFLLIFRKNKNTLQIICLSSIFAMFSGRFAEQLLGLAVVSDLTVFWICLAGSVAAVKIFLGNELLQNQEVHHTGQINKTTLTASLRIFILVLSASAILFFTAAYAIIYPVSGVFAGQSRSLYQVGKLEESLYRIETAISMTPEVPYYYFFKNILLTEFIYHPEKVIHTTCNNQANHTTDPEGYSLCLAQEMYSTASANRKINPFWYQSTFQFAIIAQSFGQEKEVLRAYEDLAELMPTNRTVLHWLSQEYITREMFDEAQDSLNQSLSISASNPESGKNEFFTDEAIKLLNETE